MRRLPCFFLIPLLVSTVIAQDHPHFNVLLRLDYSSAEKTVEVYQGLSGHPDEIARLRGSQIALATTALLARRALDLPMLERSLDAAKFNQTLDDDVFRMKEARANVAAIKELLLEVQRRNFGQRVTSTVEQIFPQDARVVTSIPMYFVAFGHENIDAYVRRVVWHGDTPMFVGENEGELTIVVNLAKAVRYGRTTTERLEGLLSVVAHEVFHAAFGVYKEGSPVWREYYADHASYLDRLLDLTQNEGIAYYLSMLQQYHGRDLPAFSEQAPGVFAEFNRNAAELLSSRINNRRASDIIGRANTSGYWQSFGSITGMFIAREIDEQLGRTALVETIAAGPADFFGKYVSLMKRDSNIPSLSAPILGYLENRNSSTPGQLR